VGISITDISGSAYGFHSSFPVESKSPQDRIRVAISEKISASRIAPQKRSGRRLSSTLLHDHLIVLDCYAVILEVKMTIFGDSLLDVKTFCSLDLLCPQNRKIRYIANTMQKSLFIQI
uniref:Uncharacterized protein n=1 Tax=Parascaris univalens TaxID=6257 RepID=A0A915BJT7_PARUN